MDVRYMGAEDKSDRQRTIRDLLIIALISVLIVVWAGIVFFTIGEKPRGWDYSIYDSVPGESYQSTRAVPKGPEPPSQVELPPVEDANP